jgi:prepilin-type processing-associated H-X9-DG protein
LGFTVISQLLPYIEQDNIYKQIDFTVAANSPNNAAVTLMPIKTLLCPADLLDAPATQGGGNNYFANYGSEPQFFQTKDIANGVFALRDVNGISMVKIFDGTSNTTAFAELSKGDFNNAVYTKPDWLNASSVGMPTTADQALTMCHSIDPKNLTYQWLSAGIEWLNDNNTGTAYTHVGLPNSVSCGFPANLRFCVNANSYHTGGVNVCMCDGSVRFVSDTITLATWRAMGTRAGGEVLGNDAY